MTEVYTKHIGSPCTLQQRGSSKSKLFQPEMHLIAYLFPRRESTWSDIQIQQEQPCPKSRKKCIHRHRRK